MTKVEILEARKAKLAEAKALTEQRDFTDENAATLNDILAEVKNIDAKLDAMAAVEDAEDNAPADEEASEERAVEKKIEHPAVIRSRGRATRSADNIHEHAAREKWSVTRAGNCHLKGRWSGVEAEVAQELGEIAGGFRMPYGDMRVLNKSYHQRDDLTTSTGAGAVLTIWDGFVGYLYPMIVGPKLGVKFTSGVRAGTLKRPRQSGVPTTTHVAEQGTATASAPDIDAPTWTLHTITASVSVSRDFGIESVVEADSYVQNAAAQQIACDVDKYMIKGTGSSNQPTGLLNISGTGAEVATSNAVAYSNIVNMHKLQGEANAEFGPLAWLTSPAGYAKLANTPKLGSTYPTFIAEDNMIEGEPVYKSSQVPKDLTYTGTGNMTPLIYGKWDELEVAFFGNGLDVLVDPYSSGSAMDVKYHFKLSYDVNAYHPAAFQIIPNVLTT